MRLIQENRFPDPKAGHTPLEVLLTESSRAHTPEDYAFGTPLAPIEEDFIASLNALSITTEEELLGYLQVPDVRSSELENVLKSEPRLEMILEQRANQEIVHAFDRVRGEKYGFGALLPPDGAIVATEESLLAAPTVEGTQALLSSQCLPPIKDQGSRGTCVAFATAAVLEFAYCIEKTQTIDVSEQFQFWHCKLHDGKPMTDATRPDVSFALVGKNGICDEAEWLYSPVPNPANVSHDPPGPSSRIDTRPPNIPTAPFRTVVAALTITPATDIRKIKGYIAAGSAVAIAIPVFNSWAANPYTRLTGNMPMPLPNERRRGGHALVLIGWADDSSFAGGGYFVVRNSWGTRWGSTSVFGPGHGTIPYDFISSLNQFAHTVKV